MSAQREGSRFKGGAKAVAKGLTKSLTVAGDAAKRMGSAAGSAAQRLTQSLPTDSSPAGLWFGVALAQQETTMDRGHRVPVLLATMRECIDEAGALATEGIFRISAEKRIQTLVRERLESGEDPESVLGGCSVELLSGLLKEYLRSLPGGAWLSGTAAEELHTELLNGGGRPTAMLLKQALPPSQLHVMNWTIDLLVEAAGEAATSKMSDENLAVVFAPLLIPGDEADPPHVQLKMAQEGILILRKLICEHREKPTRGSVKAPGRASSKRSTDRPSDGDDPMPPLRRQRSSRSSALASGLASCSESRILGDGKTGLTAYAQDALGFDEPEGPGNPRRSFSSTRHQVSDHL